MAFTVSALNDTAYANDLRVDALLSDGPDWNYLLPQRNELRFTFDVALANSAQTANVRLTPATAFNAAQQAATKAILAHVAAVTGIVFTEVASSAEADFHFAGTDLVTPQESGLCVSSWSWTTRSDGVVTAYNADAIVYLDIVNGGSTNLAPSAGNAGYQVLLHEIGHALGLGHPFENPAPNRRLAAADDNTGNTVMSYTWVGTPKSTFQSYDLLALRWIYGGDGLGGQWGLNSVNGPSLTFTAPNNSIPVGSDGSASTDEDRVLQAQLPAARDPDGDAVIYTLDTVPARGGVVISEDGRYVYTPAANANGSDSFRFTVSDGRGGRNTYTQTISVTPVNDPPTGSLRIEGIAQIFGTLAVQAQLADADGLGPLRYQWLRNGSEIGGATAASYTLEESDVGGLIGVRVQYLDAGGTTETVSMSLSVAVAGFNRLDGGPGNDILTGSEGPDSLGGLAGDDRLAGLGSHDLLQGGAGRDVLTGGAGNDTLDGGAGLDVADYRGGAAVTANLLTGMATQGSDSDRLIAIEAVFGSTGADTLRGLDGPANLPGETIRGGGGNDSIDGGTGIDRAEFSGPLSAYTITRTAGTMNLTVAHNGGGADGTDSLSNVELLLFSDRVVAFGPRVEEVARVAFALWTPPIVSSPTLFAKGISFYTNEFGYDIDTLCQVALQYWPETGAQTAARLKASIPAVSFTTQQLIDIMAANGGVDSIGGRAAAVKAVALDPATTAQLQATGVLSNGIVATLGFPGETPDYFSPLPG